jgi:hypothetical protein
LRDTLVEKGPDEVSALRISRYQEEKSWGTPPKFQVPL